MSAVPEIRSEYGRTGRFTLGGPSAFPVSTDGRRVETHRTDVSRWNSGLDGSATRLDRDHETPASLAGVDRTQAGSVVTAGPRRLTKPPGGWHGTAAGGTAVAYGRTADCAGAQPDHPAHPSGPPVT